ncbi:hypothetical protein COV18_05265 [Candidatus Woesearchaeota archaeon CG10_big_fil_rev_8_21_14_0_10_37_12]|nr:MAG: hypothetical protein COV18_05265 [Candidatus Woesearchaeota archaeon CG10_big_fil_rev_8_21_14_0_10_37_12]
MSKKVRIAVAQMRIVKEDECLKKAEEFIKKASKKSADIVVFPEYVANCPLGKPKLLLARKREPHKRFFEKLAKKFDIDIVPGSIIERQNKKFYNTTYYISSEGKTLAKYRKQKLWGNEENSITAGKQSTVVKTKFGKIGLIICWDLAFPEVFDSMARKGAKIIICPSYWSYEDAKKGLKYNHNAEVIFVNSLCTSRAYVYELALVYCNAAGTTYIRGKEVHLLGRSQVAVPFIGPLKRASHNRECLLIADIDLDILKDARKVYKIRAGLKK